ncbi:Hypothetical predicted protein [Podarcis lilfordi]|uniref:Uncharacterized protein n=1 Tax=Podarcis lilfordi TaxID=74358 RepID=A0AA35P105_9SAUR|nr:Hypothetical predicted protein [Podarcis lilfordi]
MAAERKERLAFTFPKSSRALTPQQLLRDNVCRERRGREMSVAQQPPPPPPPRPLGRKANQGATDHRCQGCAH